MEGDGGMRDLEMQGNETSLRERLFPIWDGGEFYAGGTSEICFEYVRNWEVWTIRQQENSLSKGKTSIQ